jgi:hypothetical protein
MQGVRSMKPVIASPEERDMAIRILDNIDPY